MLGFRQYIKEYLTPEQHARYRDITMTPDARKATDHFFGPDNDMVREPIKGYDGDKSEVHKAIEKHVGHEFSIDEYKAGMTRGPSGKKVTIPSLIADKQLKHQFNQDNTRTGKGMGHTHYVTVVRGTEVAGQTNSVPDRAHPKGHCWGDHSCKNIETGSNRHYLEPEIRHGTVAVRIHDPNHQEIYRATLQPHHNDKGDTAYSVDSEYGLTHPAFTAHADDVAKRLSGEYKPGVFVKHEDVYNNDDTTTMIHPAEITPERFAKADTSEKQMILSRKSLPSGVLDHALRDDSYNIRRAAIDHPELQSHHIDMALNDKVAACRATAMMHSNLLKPHHLDKAVTDSDPTVAELAIKHQLAQPHHIETVLGHPYYTARAAAISHPDYIKPHYIDKALGDPSDSVREAALIHLTAVQPHHIDRVLDDPKSVASVKRHALIHPTATQPSHIDKVLIKDDPIKAYALEHSPAVQSHHIDIGLADSDHWVRIAAIRNQTAVQSRHIDQALADPHKLVRQNAVAIAPNIQMRHINQALQDPEESVRKEALNRKRSLTVSPSFNRWLSSE